MSASEEATTIRVSRETHEKLAESKPYDSMSFDDLLREMVEEFDASGARV